MELTKRQQFLVTMIPFAVLGAAFKVMVLVEGFTEVRPANAIPVISGLSFGPVGALGCALGNLIADCFGTLDLTSLLGLLGNFVASYLPYRLWHLFREEDPNVHTFKNLLFYVYLSLISAITVAWILGFGLELFFGLWLETIFIYVFFNNFGFSLALGLPLFIVFTSDSINLAMRKPGRPGKNADRTGGNPSRIHGRSCVQRRWGRILTYGYTCLMGAVLAGVFSGFHAGNSAAMTAVTCAGALALAALCLVPWNYGKCDMTADRETPETR